MIWYIKNWEKRVKLNDQYFLPLNMIMKIRRMDTRQLAVWAGLDGGEGQLSWLPDRQALAIKTNQGWRQIQVDRDFV